MFREKIHIERDNIVMWFSNLSNTVKKLFEIPVPSRDVTYQTLAGRE
jgi:hypothetical protein